MLADKAAFAAYVVEQGLGALCPLHYANADATFPCVLKRLDLNAGRGIVRVQSEQELHDLLGREPWLGKPYLLQQYIPSGDDYVTHAVLRNGQIIWHRSYRYAINPDDPIRGPANTGDIEKADPPAAAIAQLNRFLAPLGYNGPVNVDYRFADNGALKVIEINPRLGGSLMRPDNLDDLAEMLSTIIENAI
jgi:glutathione synthase/RimK-type ligase-like ATP-grasp enzyme